MTTIDRWDDIKIFNVCLKYRSLSQAANHLGIQQSTVSRRIQAFEDNLGGSLFVRTSEGIIPTPLALEISSSAQAMEEHFYALERVASGHEPEPQGEVKIALVEPVAMYVMMPLLDDLYKTFPKLHINLISSYTQSDLTRLEADIALRFVKPSTGDLIAKKLITMPLKVLASDEYLARYGTPTLDSGRWVNVSLPWLAVEEERWFKQYVTVQPWLQTSSYTVATEAIIKGKCVGLTTELMERLQPAHLRPVSVDAPLPEPLEMWLVTHASMRHTPKVSAVWDWLIRTFEV